MVKYRKKVEVEAIRWTGTKENLEECEKFAGRSMGVSHGHLIIGYGEYAPKGHYIIKETDGIGLYALDPRIFEQLYEEVK